MLVESKNTKISYRINSLYQTLERPLHSNYWQLKIVILCIFVAGFMQIPRYQYFYRFAIIRDGSNVIYTAFEKQVEAPFEPRIYTPGSHEAKMAVRLTVPLIINLLCIPPAGFIVVQFLVGILMLTALVKLFYDLTNDRLSTAFLMVGLCCTYFGAAFFFDVMGMFDAFSYTILVLMMFYRNAIALSILVIVGAFTDERVIIAAPIAILWHVCRDNISILKQSWSSLFNIFVRNSQAIGIILGAIVYIFTRLYILNHYHLNTDNGFVGLSALSANALGGALEVGLFSALEAFWIIVIASLAILVSTGAYRLLILFVLAALPIYGGAFLVFDITRSICYGTPVILISLYFLLPYLSKVSLRHLSAFVMFASIFLPTLYVITSCKVASSFINYLLVAVLS